MKVKALQKGYYGEKIREVGEVFDLADSHKIGRWMEPVEDTPVASVAASAPAAAPGRITKADLLRKADELGVPGVTSDNNKDEIQAKIDAFLANAGSEGEVM